MFCPPLMHCRWEKQMAHSRNSAPARLSPDRGVTLPRSCCRLCSGVSPAPAVSRMLKAASKVLDLKIPFLCTRR